MFRCPECRTRRKDYGLFLKHLANSGHSLCDCGGYHYKHRKGSKFCKFNDAAVLNEAYRRDASPEEILDIKIDMAWDAKFPTSSDCPF